jgi:DNA-binding MarR family transcriptional regulator
MESIDTQAGFDVACLLLRCHLLERGLAGSAGLTVDEFHCLSQIYAIHPASVKQLCELTGFHPTRASRVLNGLEGKGYLIRSLGATDRRKELLTLTPAGIGAARSLLQSCALSGHGLIARASEGPEDAGDCQTPSTHERRYV